MSTPALVAHPHTPFRRVVVVGVALAAVLSVILLAFLWPTVTSSVKALPIAIAAPAEQADQLAGALEERSPGAFDVKTVADRATAVDLIETRQAYGAIVLGSDPEVTVYVEPDQSLSFTTAPPYDVWLVPDREAAWGARVGGPPNPVTAPRSRGRWATASGSTRWGSGRSSPATASSRPPSGWRWW